MIKGTLLRRSDHRLSCVVLGLSHQNLDRLRADQPIRVSGQDLGLDHDIMIFSGPTEADMARTLAEAGLVDERTAISPHDDEESLP